MQPTGMIQALSRPEAYPDHPTEVSMRQTHISWLFFTRDYVYKVKKPVNFGFLDFTSLEARRFFCEEEARLNRRLAPNIYLGVCEITETDGQIRLGGRGQVVDYALQMRRLPEERMLPALLPSGEVTSQTMRRLAQLLATFHAQAETGPEIKAYGSLGTIRQNWDENFEQTQPYADWPLDRGAYEHLRRRVLTFCQRQNALFERRIADGRIRDGHGDLRAEHICLTEPIVIFDCIEFNHRFRYADVAADVAFLAMDLDERGFPSLSQAFVQAYVRASGDGGLMSVLDFYKCYRAFVRAKVECLRLDDPTVTPGDARLAARAARRYGQLAACYAERLRRPWLLLCCGLMGSGKSVLAQELAVRMDLVVLSSDIIRKKLAGIEPTTPAPAAYGEGLYSAEWTEAVYTHLISQAASLLSQGHSVLLDASFQRARHRLQARQLAVQAGAEFAILECWCPEEELQRRLQARMTQGDSASDGRWELLAQQRQTFEPLFEVPPSEHLKVDTTQAPQALAATIIRTLHWHDETPWPSAIGAFGSATAAQEREPTRRYPEG